MNPASPFSHPLYVMAKPAGAKCNLACDYCYYLEKRRLYDPADNRHTMSDETLERFIAQYIEAQTTDFVSFVWHGGEPTVRPLSFYEKVIRLQQKYGRGLTIENSLQTNATLLDEKWCRFLRDNGWLVGVSIDGPQRFHDEYRIDPAGKPSFQRVMKGIRLLQRYGIDWNAMAVVNSLNAGHPAEFYNFFKEIGCRFIQFTPVVERVGHEGHLKDGYAPGGELTPFSVTPRQWGEFLTGVFDQWIKTDVGKVFVQIFDATLANWVGANPGVCTLARRCGHAAVLEYNGDLYCCDHFVFPGYRLGNIADKTIIEMMSSERQQQFGLAKETSLPDQCRRCRFNFACNGECPRNRFATTADGQPGLNYLCEGYQMFFNHVEPYMNFMRDQLRAGLPPADVMKTL